MSDARQVAAQLRDAADQLDPRPQRAFMPVNVGIDFDGRPRDALGRKVPFRFDLLTWMRVLPSLRAAMRHEVPASFIAEDVTTDGTPVAIISCPCGRTPSVELAQLEACDCGRAFGHFGRRILCARPGDEPDAVPEPDSEPTP